MDRRYCPRISTELPVRLTQLDSDVEFDGQLQDVSESGICALVHAPFEPGAIVKLDVLGLCLYGHVVYSSGEEDGVFRTGVFVEPAILDSSNIVELIEQFLITASR